MEPVGFQKALNIFNKIHDHFSAAMDQAESDSLNNPAKIKALYPANHVERLTGGKIYTPRHVNTKKPSREVLEKYFALRLRDNAKDTLRR